MRYILILLFVAFVPLPVLGLDAIFAATGSGLSIHDTRGAGQVLMLLTVLLTVLAYVVFVARDDIGAWIGQYLSKWRRALSGFLLMLAVSWAIVIGAYLIAWALDFAHFSPEAWQALNLNVAERTAVALLVVFVLATTEELMFRVFIMRYLRTDTSALATIGAVVVSSLIFAAVHKPTDLLGWFTAEEFPLFVGLFLLGVLLCTAYIATGSFWAGVAVHAGLLGSKVFLRRTGVLEVETGSWLLGGSDDIRRAPLVWALFAGMALAIYLLRRGLNARFSVERPVVSSAPFPALPKRARTGI